MYLRATLGAAIANLAKERSRLEELEPAAAAKAIEDAALRGVKTGLAGLGSVLARYAEGIGRIATVLQEVEKSSR